MIFRFLTLFAHLVRRVPVVVGLWMFFYYGHRSMEVQQATIIFSDWGQAVRHQWTLAQVVAEVHALAFHVCAVIGLAVVLLSWNTPCEEVQR